MHTARQIMHIAMMVNFLISLCVQNRPLNERNYGVFMPKF